MRLTEWWRTWRRGGYPPAHAAGRTAPLVAPPPLVLPELGELDGGMDRPHKFAAGQVPDGQWCECGRYWTDPLHRGTGAAR